MRGVGYSEDGQEQAGMGVAVGDFTGEGHLDIFKTNFAGDLPVLYRNLGKGVFEDATRTSGLAVDNRFVCWARVSRTLTMMGGRIFPSLQADLS